MDRRALTFTGFFAEVFRVCGKWVFFALVGVWIAGISTWQGVEAWKKQIRLQQEFGSFPDDELVPMARREKWENFFEAAAGAAVGTFAIVRGRRRWVRVKRTEYNLCLACGYDLKGNTSGVCSECGAAIMSPPPIDLDQAVGVAEHDAPTTGDGEGRTVPRLPRDRT